MNQTTTTTLHLPTVVGNAFLRVLKNYKLYHLFQQGFQNRRKGGDSKIGGYKNLNELMAQIMVVAEHDYEKMAHDKNKYEYITFIINTLIRVFLEPAGVPPQKLGFYGQEIFDLVCYKMYGDQYLEEMNTLNHGAPKPTNEFEAWLIGQFMGYKNGGGEESFDEWVARNSRAIDQARAAMGGQMSRPQPHMYNEDASHMETFYQNDDKDDDWPF